MREAMYLEGAEETTKLLEGLPGKIVKKTLRKAVSAAGTPIRRAVIGEAPVDTGALRKSIGKRTKLYTRSGVAVVIVGPKANFTMGKRRPSKYQHLVELGHAVVRRGSLVKGKKGTGVSIAHVPPNPYTQRGLKAARQAALQKYIEKLRQGIDQIVKAGDK